MTRRDPRNSRRLVGQMVLAAALVGSLLSGCSGVVPWEREYRLRAWQHARHNAEIAFLRKQLDEALDFQKQALAESQGLGGLTVPDYRTGITYNEIGLIYKLKKEWSKAEESYSKAVDILQKCIDASKDPLSQRLLRHDLAGSLLGVANMQIERLSKDLEPSKKLLDSASKLEKESWKPTPEAEGDVLAGQQLAKIITLSAYASVKQGRMEDAASKYSEALRVARESACSLDEVTSIRDAYREVLKALGRPDPWAVDESAWSKHFAEGEKALTAGDLQTAEQAYKQSLVDAEKLVPLSVRKSMRSMKRLCQVYKQQNRTDDFIGVVQHAMTYKIDTLTGLAANDFDWVLNVYSNFVTAPEQRLKIQMLKLSLRKRVFGADDWHVAETLTTIASILHELNRDVEARGAAGRACNILSGHPKRKRRFADDRIKLANVCESLGELKRAELLYRQILHIYIKINRPGDERTKTAVLKLAEMCRRQGKNQEAIEAERFLR